MTSSLVGSEMCIRDSTRLCRRHSKMSSPSSSKGERIPRNKSGRGSYLPCLLYTSDAADDM
eukprot:6205583-Prorocentrum_lima.AAC.1